uniref:Virion-associated protein n=1 Tax=Dahlia mosaic virus TaxID=213888 RepID=S5QF81_DMV|nr:DNA binding protein [Dahlia mosaic virus]
MSFVKIEEMIKELIKKVDALSTNDNLEVIAAKIIKDVSDIIDNKAFVFEKQKEKIKIEEKRFQKYSFPNFNVGNPSLGSSKSPNALKWPFGSTSNDE